MGMKKTTAFTLIEVLVVVSIIGLLAAILVPSLAKARAQAKRVSCATQLHQVGVAMIAYMQDNRDRMPYVSYMPSVDPAPLTSTVRLAVVLKRYLRSGKTAMDPAPSDPSAQKVIMPLGTGGAFECPNDVPNFSDREGDNKGLSYYQSEWSSYAYRLRLAGLTPSEFTTATGGPHSHLGEADRDRKKQVPFNTIWFANDYNNFHGKAGQIGARRYAYIDGHVSDFEN
jgi:prepilin-type N-terminal cleavage/methylation domain-containing protein